MACLVAEKTLDFSEAGLTSLTLSSNPFGPSIHRSFFDPWGLAGRSNSRLLVLGCIDADFLSGINHDSNQPTSPKGS